MRELKFRAWDNNDKRYRYAFNMDDFGKVIEYVDGEKVYMPYIVEQDTGLKDKNGKEIYENDIIEEKIDTGDYDIDGTYRYKVVWDDDMLCWSLDPNGTSIHKDLWECNQSLKVIGNIHENPELARGKE